MLVAHSSSTCDVCLENYTEDSSYHAIPCGHIFCLPCLMNTDPPRCPLCRHDFSSYSIRKIHISLPTPRDAEAHNFEKKLLENGPNAPFEESYTLFEEIQAWIREDDREEYLMLRAFAACLCSYHELRVKCSNVEERLQIERSTAEETQTELRRSLDEARRISSGDGDNYETKYRLAELELADLRNESVTLRAQVAGFQQQEQDEYDRLEALRSQLQASETEINTLRTECASLRSQVESSYREKQRLQIQIRQAKQVVAEHRKFYADYVAQMDQQGQQVLVQQEAITSRRKSNPLPPPPKFIDLDALRRSKLRPESSKGPDKGKNRDASEDGPSNHDPMTSAYVPTLTASIAAANISSKKDGSDSDGRSEVTTLIFKPPARMPMMPQLKDQYLIGDADLHMYNQAGPSSAVYQEPVTATEAGPSRARPDSVKMIRATSLHVSQPGSSRNAEFSVSTDFEGPPRANPRVKASVLPPFKLRRPPEELGPQPGRQPAPIVNENIPRRSHTIDVYGDTVTMGDSYDSGEHFPVTRDPTYHGTYHEAPTNKKPRTRHDSYGYSYMPPMYYAPEYMVRPEPSNVQSGYYNPRYQPVRPRRRSTGYATYGYGSPPLALDTEDMRTTEA